MCPTVHNILLSLLCSPSALVANRLKMMCFVSHIAAIMGLCKHMSAGFCFCFSPVAICFLGARAAELLINTDQNPQRGRHRPQTFHRLRLPRARSHCWWLHSLQPQLWVCHCSWRYVWVCVHTGCVLGRNGADIQSPSAAGFGLLWLKAYAK